MAPSQSEGPKRPFFFQIYDREATRLFNGAKEKQGVIAALFGFWGLAALVLCWIEAMRILLLRAPKFHSAISK